MVERQAKLLMKKGGGKTLGKKGARGRSGKVGKKIFVSSKPGEPPRVRTGNLRASIKSAWDKQGTRSVAGPTLSAPYGKWLEFGTRRMAPRPYMQPALLFVVPRLPALFRNMPLARTPAGRTLNAGPPRPLPGATRNAR